MKIAHEAPSAASIREMRLVLDTSGEITYDTWIYRSTNEKDEYTRCCFTLL